MKNKIENLNSGGLPRHALALALALALHAAPLPSFPSVNDQFFRAYPRLTAPIRGKSRLFAPNRAKNFSGVPAPATAVALLAPQVIAPTCINLHTLAQKNVVLHGIPGATDPSFAFRRLRLCIGAGGPPPWGAGPVRPVRTRMNIDRNAGPEPVMYR